MSFSKIAETIYNRGNLSKEELIDRFVVRHKIFKRIYSKIQSADMEAEPSEHLLIIGIRGMGKTTLLLRLAYEIERDEKLSQYLLPIVFTEEQYGIRNLYSFWEHIARFLEDEYKEFTGLFERMDNLYNSENESQYEELIFRLLIEEIQTHKKKLILFVDNLQDFLKKLSDQESRRLRDILMTCKDLRIVGGSPITVEASHI